MSSNNKTCNYAATTAFLELLDSIADDKLVEMALKCVSTKISEIPLRKVFDLSPKRSVSNILNWEPKEIETHTGQKWEKDDYRLARFVDKTKLVNPNWAIKLIAEVPPQGIKGRVVCCDGGSGPTGHPKVYINLDKPGNHSCLYCGLRFYKEESKH